MSNCISVENVDFAYDDMPVLEGISFQVSDGDYVGIIGPNGGGKTTLLHLLLGLYQPQRGKISVLGQATDERHHRYEIGYVPQRVVSSHQFFPATVQEVVASARTAAIGFLKKFSAEDRAIVVEAMKEIGVYDLRNRLIGELSGGQRQRVFIARALARQPKILILDEPTAGVDIAAQKSFYTLLEHLNREHKITIILVSHDVDVVAKHVKYVLCLNRRLLCHVSAENFIHGNFLEQLYGKDVKFVAHHG